MMDRRKKAMQKRTMKALWSSFVAFLVVAILLTISFSVFLQVMAHTTEFTLTEENIRPAAVVTFLTVLLLTLVGMAADSIRRKIMVERPVRHIIMAADKIATGDFSARIPPLKNYGSMDGYDVIINYINKIAEELSGVETLRTDFIANVSHELKTLLAVIQNYGTLLQTPNLAEEKRLEYAKSITDSTRRLTDLITNILKLNRLENQQIYPDQKTYNLGEQLAECLLNFEDTWAKKEIEIDTDIEEEVFVESDAELLTLVWNNLFSNAFKFTGPGGTVSLKLKSENEWAVVRICNG